MTQIALSEQTAAKLTNYAAQRGTDVTKLVEAAIDYYIAHKPSPIDTEIDEEPWEGWDEQQRQIGQEQQAYEAQHADLLKQYAGQYIAMHEGKVVDHDLDKIALYRRIRTHYGNQAVLITPVLQEPRQIITVRSPRLIYEG